MFIRRTKTRSTVPGKEYYTHRLVRSERVGKKVQQRSLLNLGRHFDIDQKHWPDLCARIEQLLQPQATLPVLPLDDFLEKEVRSLSKKSKGCDFGSSCCERCTRLLLRQRTQVRLVVTHCVHRSRCGLQSLASPFFSDRLLDKSSPAW